ncbi:MAG: SDR family NAD(P)-dependent oxidoreductase [Myxococcaceae bacterium]
MSSLNLTTSPLEFRSRWVLVTGASSGLGLHISRQLAHRHKANLVLVARREAKLRELQNELENEAGVEVATVTADLSRIEDVDRVFEEATRGRDLYAAVLNAGVTHFGRHDELTWEGFQQMLATNVQGVVRMSMHLAPYLERQKQGGGMLLVSSMAGLVPVAYQSAYSGTKAFLLNYGSGLHHELRDRNVSVTLFAPGGIQTEMTAGEKFGPLRAFLMPVEACATAAIDAFRHRAYLEMPGITNRLGYAVTRMLPQRFVTGRVAATYRSALNRVAKAASGTGR